MRNRAAVVRNRAAAVRNRAAAVRAPAAAVRTPAAGVRTPVVEPCSLQRLELGACRSQRERWQQAAGRTQAADSTTSIHIQASFRGLTTHEL